MNAGPAINNSLGDHPEKMATREIHTIGHSNHPFPAFLELLGRHGIELLIDVRSSPYATYATQFSREALDASLAEAGVDYVYLGDRLGGRPEGSQFYDDDGHVRYWRVAQTDAFRQAIAQVERFCDGSRVAIMCSEGDPTHCHRRLLVGRVLYERGTCVRHIRADGRLESETDLLQKERLHKSPFQQLTLFDEPEVNPWRSTRSVLPRSGHRSSSGS